MVNVTMPTGMRDEEWVRFFGAVKFRAARELTLSPDEDELIKIIHCLQDVHIVENPNDVTVIFVRKGARVVDIETIGSNYDKRPIQSLRANHVCTGGSKCLGNVEYCCGGGGTVVGACYGVWKCSRGSSVEVT
ncbi:hypothetical protein [Variovorax rhizosphaerae]|uniref:Uncharacterized protein n=1 Tax=Variovorax rhizosphaerae TaxID=1836200 RepID=A0ABU8WE41_9BURK